MNSAVAVGLDIGTTISVAAFVDSSGDPKVIGNDEEGPLVPSAIFFANEVLIGQQAQQLSEQSLDDYAESFKRDIGKPHYSKRLKLCEVPPEVLTAFLIEYLTTNLKQQHEVRDLVVTVPASFDHRQRCSTQRAAALVGFDNVKIINEPTAAAIAAGHSMFNSAPASPRKILVYDLGGGTFDTTLLEFDNTTFRTLATDGDVRLGGRDFDERIATIIAEAFLQRHGMDPRSDPSDMIKLANLANEAKHTLSQHESTDVSFCHAGLLLELTLSRKMLEEAIAPLIERTVLTSREMLGEAGLLWQDIDEILLVGGSSRIPFVKSRLEQEAGKPARLMNDPDQLVARGAALYAAQCGQAGFVDPSAKFEIVNVNAHSLGIQGVDLATGKRVNHVIIPRNTALPASTSRLYQTMHAGQRNVRVRLLEGDAEDPVYCTALGQCVVHLEPNLPKGTQVRVDTCYDANGTIAVSAQVPSTSASARVELHREGFADLEPLDVWRSRLTCVDADSELHDPHNAASLPAVTLSPESNFEDILSRLDQVYSLVGMRYTDRAVSDCASGPQRLMNRAGREVRELKKLIEVLNMKQQQEPNSKNRMQLQGHCARARMAWNQANRLYLHSRISFGRIILRECPASIDPSLLDSVFKMENWLNERTAA